MENRESGRSSAHGGHGASRSHYWPIWQLTLSRMRVFYREPAAVFWVYGFPLVMALSLGTAFRENPKESIAVDLVSDAVESRKSQVESQADEKPTATAWSGEVEKKL